MIAALLDVQYERGLQDSRFGEQNHPNEKFYTILGEEFGEVGKAILDGDKGNLRDELVQVAAVAVAFIEMLDRREEFERVGRE